MILRYEFNLLGIHNQFCCLVLENKLHFQTHTHKLCERGKGNKSEKTAQKNVHIHRALGTLNNALELKKVGKYVHTYVIRVTHTYVT